MGSTTLQQEGIDATAPYRTYLSSPMYGSRINLGFWGAEGGGSSTYLHLKLNLPDNGNVMVKFEFNGYWYDSYNIHNSLTFYTYHGTNSPYTPSLVDWGEQGGIVNYYYSSDNKVVIVLRTSANYTGGFLYCQTGRSHAHHSIEVAAYSSSTNNSGVY